MRLRCRCVQFSAVNGVEMTKLLSVISVALLLGAGCRPGAEEAGKRFYVQLVRGNDQEQPPVPGATMAGPRVTERLQGVLRWKHYWEVERDSLVVSTGHKVRKRISPEREVEIEMSQSQDVAVRIYMNGKLAQIRKQPATGAFFITGGDKGKDQSWFIVVRDDEPLNPGLD